MFEAIHGSAPALIEAGLERFANPSSMLRAAVMMLNHIGLSNQAIRLENALDKCVSEAKVVMDGRKGATNEEYIEYLMEFLV